jgi:hypothetical protein
VYKPGPAKFSIKKLSASDIDQIGDELLESFNAKKVNLSYMLTCSVMQELIVTLCKKFNTMQWSGISNTTLTITRTHALALCIAAEDMPVNSMSFKVAMLIKQQLLNQHYDIFRKG